MNNNKEIFDALIKGEDVYAQLRCASPGNVQDYLRSVCKIAVPYLKCEQLSDLLTVYLILKKRYGIDGDKLVMNDIERYIINDMELE